MQKSEKRLKEIEEAIETDACLEKELQAVGAEFNYQMKQSLNDITGGETTRTTCRSALKYDE